MDVLIVVDMQVGLRRGAPKHDLTGVVARINSLAAKVRAQGGQVVWIRHCGVPGDDFAPDQPGWAFLPELDRQAADIEVAKTLNDPFAGTELKAKLAALAPARVLVAGWATDFCVDATVRSTVSNGFDVVVVSDAHTLSDRPHLAAPDVIRHHNWIWANLITQKSIRVMPTREVLADSAGLVA
jgi:nicotinamidase-related amidase